MEYRPSNANAIGYYEEEVEITPEYEQDQPLRVGKSQRKSAKGRELVRWTRKYALFPQYKPTNN